MRALLCLSHKSNGQDNQLFRMEGARDGHRPFKQEAIVSLTLFKSNTQDWGCRSERKYALFPRGPKFDPSTAKEKQTNKPHIVTGHH